MQRLRQRPQWMREIAERLNIKRQAPYTWWRVPSERVLVVAAVTGMSPHEIRPDLYPERLMRKSRRKLKAGFTPLSSSA